ncbi:MAG: methyltransferase domain-containing protein [Pirellulales bacterium]|nr:methyltransferase domain-containing protein [Pirellulales bacterium]
MFNYVYMKLLESQPDRYDRGIKWLSLGQSETVKRRIVAEYVIPGSRMLDIGCGTGTLAVLAAQKGAQVTAFDISPGMLAVARRKVVAGGLAERIELHERGVAGMGTFPEASFDLITATLVFSELSYDEQTYVLSQAYRILTPAGRVVIADEAKPESVCKRAFHAAVRVPLLLITFALTQTKTKAVVDLERLVSQAGFKIQNAERSRLGSFLYLLAVKENA